MKAIGIKMVELQPMFSGEARIKGYKVLESLGDNELGYEVTYLDGYKSWTPKDIAKYGLNAESKKDKYPSHVQRMIDEYKELDDRINKLASFINTNPIFEALQNEEREDMKAQLIWMHKYINVLANRLRRQNVEPSKLLDK